MANLKDVVRKAKDADAAKKGGSALAIRELEKESTRLFGEGASDAKFDWRNEQRAALGLEPEKRKRGGLAGQYDKGTLLPMLAMAAAPLALMGAGVASPGAAAGAGGGATAAGGTAASMGGLPPIPAAGGAVPGAAGGFGGMAASAGNWLKDPKNLMKLGAGAYGISQQQKGAGIMNDALKRDTDRWNQGAPLRDAGMAGMLNPIPADTSSLAGLAGQGNPFAKKPLPPMPAGGLR
jgi:hypothetical protein